MANSTLLQLMSRSMQAMGITTDGLPATIINNANQDVVQTFALVNTEGDSIAREHEWQALRLQEIFEATSFSYTGNVTSGSTTIASMSSIASLDNTFMVEGVGILQNTRVVSAAGTDVVIDREPNVTGTTVALTFSKIRFAFPTAFDRPVDQTNWDTSRRWEQIGPTTMQQNAWLKSGYISTGPRMRFISFGNFYEIWPPQGVDVFLQYDYLTKNWIYATGGTATTKQIFTLDTDTCIFPDALMYAMIRLKYFEAKGFDTAKLQDKYDIQLALAKSHDGGSQNLSMAPTLSNVLIGEENIPDSGYGS